MNTPGARTPDFIVIGTMKSGTTTLFRWLSEVPGIELPSMKEPGFFAHEAVWNKGLDWYRQIFADIPESAITGEASVIYSDPEYADGAALRIASTLPDVRLICILRDPIARLRSHYRHEVQRGRERRPFLDAVADPTTAYVRRSDYHAALAPYLDRFDREQLLVIPMVETMTSPHTSWYEILDYLCVEAVPPEGSIANITAEKPGFSRPALRLWEWGLIDPVARRSPKWARRIGRRALLRDSASYRRLLASAAEPLPNAIVDLLQESLDDLEHALDRSFVSLRPDG